MFRRQAGIIMGIALVALVVGCGKAQPAAMSLPATNAPVPPTETPMSTTPVLAPPKPTPTQTPVLRTDTPMAPTGTVTSVPTETATRLPTSTPAMPDDLRLDLPLGQAPTIDGTLAAAEWSGARTISLAEGELLFLHDGSYLYLGIRSDAPSLGSICVEWEDRVAVLHSSASLGTAIYERSGEGWERTRDFAWTRNYGSHLTREGWLASDANAGTRGEMEYQIAMPEGVIRLVVVLLKETDLTSPIVWPEHLADDCRETQLLRGYAPARMRLSPETWITVVATSTPVPVAAQMRTIAFDSDDGIYWMDVAADRDPAGDTPRLLVANAFGAAWSPGGDQIAFASARDGGRLGIFTMAVPEGSDTNGSEVRRLTDVTLGGMGPTWSPDGTQIAFVADQGGNWDIYVVKANGSDLRRLTFDSAIDGHPAWSPDGVHISFTSERDGNADIYILNVTDGGEPTNLTRNAAVDAAPDWSPDGRQIVFYSNRGGGAENIYLMDNDGSHVTQLTNSRAGDWHPAWSPDGSHIAFVSYRNHRDGDAEIYVIDLAGGPESGGNRPQRLTFSPAHDENPTWRPVAPEQEVKAISAETVDQVELVHTLSGHSDRVVKLAFSGDGAYVASSSWDRTIKLWDVQSGQEVHTFPLNQADWNGIGFSPDGRFLASADTIWDVESKQVVHALERGRKIPGAVSFSPDGSTLAVALESQPIRLWDVASGQVLRTFEEQADPVTFSITFSPDGALLAASVHGGMVRLWDVARGQVTGTLEHGNEGDDVHDVAFSADGSLLASGGTDQTARLWNVASRQSLHVLRHGDGLSAVAFSPDGSLLASAGRDRTVKLWDVASGRLARSLDHDDEVWSVAFAPDGSLMASGGYDHQVYLWGIDR